MCTAKEATRAASTPGGRVSRCIVYTYVFNECRRGCGV